MAEYRSTAEGRLWSAALLTFYIDAAQRNLKEPEWQNILAQANSKWIKHVCSMLLLEHSFFIENLKKVRKSRTRIIIGDDLIEQGKDFRSMVVLANQSIGRIPPKPKKKRKRKPKAK